MRYFATYFILFLPESENVLIINTLFIALAASSASSATAKEATIRLI